MYAKEVGGEALSFIKVATQPFTAGCGHLIETGEAYHVTYNPHRATKCTACSSKMKEA